MSNLGISFIVELQKGIHTTEAYDCSCCSCVGLFARTLQCVCVCECCSELDV